MGSGFKLFIYFSLSSLLPAGKLSDRFGYRVVFILDRALFGVASFMRGVCYNFWFLLFLRFIQGIGAALAMPPLWLCCQSNFPEEKRNRAQL